MAAVGGTVLTLLDAVKRRDPTGRIMPIVELLEQKNTIMEDIPWVEGNLTTGHRCAMRTGLPTVAWRLLNQGVTPSKSTTAHVDEQAGMMEGWSEVDRDLAELGGNVGEFRYSEALAFVEAMRQEFASTLFYGNAGLNPEEFTGLSVRYSDIGAGAPENAQNIIDGGGTGSDNSSIWLIVRGQNSVFGFYPKGTMAGLQHEDKGMVTLQGATGIGTSRLDVYQEKWQWKCGLAVKDWRYAVRLCNIDISNLVAKSSATDITEKMQKAIHRVPNLMAGRAGIYCNRTVFQEWCIQRRDDVGTGGGFTFENVDGVIKYSYMGIPVRICDALVETEARVV